MILKNKTNLDGLDDDAKEYIKDYQSKQIGKEMQNEIIKFTKKYENIMNKDKKLTSNKITKKFKIK